MLTGLGHGSVGRGDHEDGPVHLGGAGDHVLDVVGVAGHVDVGVVPVGRLVLDVGDRDGDAPLLLFGCLVDLVERREFRGGVVVVEDLGNGRGERGLPMVDVTHRSHVDVGLIALKLLLGHGWGNAPWVSGGAPSGPPRRRRMPSVIPRVVLLRYWYCILLTALILLVRCSASPPGRAGATPTLRAPWQ